MPLIPVFKGVASFVGGGGLLSRGDSLLPLLVDPVAKLHLTIELSPLSRSTVKCCPL